MKIIQAKKYSPNSSPRKGKIKGFTLHHFAGKMNPKAATEFWQTASGAPNYSVHNDGTIMQHVQDNRRAWTSGYKNWYGAANDHETLTVEIENEAIGGDWAVSDKALKSVIWLIATKFEEYGIDTAYFTGVMTKGKTSGFGDLGTIRGHKQVAPTECPGDFLWARMNYVADEVNKLLNPKPTPKPTTTNLYRVQTPVLTPTQADNTIQKLTRHKIESVKVQTTDGLRVQAGAFADKKKAAAQVDRANGLGFGFAINPEESTEVLYKVQTNVLTKHLANKVTATLRANGLDFITLVVNNGHVVQIGAYGKLANAHKRVDTLRGLGVQTVIVTDTGEKITPKNRTAQVKEIATKIWTDPNHPYGDGAERRKTLGDLYTDVQKYIEKHFIK